MIPRFKPSAGCGDVARFVIDILRDEMDNEAVGDFEALFARYHGAGHAVFMPSGRAALFALLKALNYPPRSEIIVPAFTHFSVPAVVKALGLTPVFADIAPETCAITAETAARAVTPKTRAIVPTHLFGRTCPMPDLLELARENKIAIVEDCAQALGASLGGAPVGGAGIGAYFTFGPTKNFTTSVGGMALCRDAELAARVQAGIPAPRARIPRLKLLKSAFLTSGMIAAARRPAFNISLAPLLLAFSNGNKPDFLHRLFDEPVRGIDNPKTLAAAQIPGMPPAKAGIRALNKIDENNAARRSIGSALRAALLAEGFEETDLPAPAPENGDHIYTSFAVRRDNRFEFIKAMRKSGVDVSPGYVTNCAAFPALGGPGPGQCPSAEKTAGRIVHLPLYPGLTGKDILHIASAARRANSISGAGK